MKRTTLLILGLLCLRAAAQVGDGPALLGQVRQPVVASIAQDGDGWIWATLASPMSAPAVWHEGTWHHYGYCVEAGQLVAIDAVQDPRLQPTSHPLFAHSPIANSDGWVYLVWYCDDTGEVYQLVTRHRGARAEVLARVGQADSPALQAIAEGVTKLPQSVLPVSNSAPPPSRVVLSFGDDGQLWVSEMGGTVFRIGSDGKPDRTYLHVDSGNLFGESTTSTQTAAGYSIGLGRPLSQYPLEGLADGRGRMWFHETLHDVTHRIKTASIRGFVLYADGEFSHLPSLPGLPQEPITCTALVDPQHLWVGTLCAGLYVVDLDTLTAETVQEPEPHAFQLPLCVFRSAEDCYVLAAPDTLWRLRDGTWTQVFDAASEDAGRVRLRLYQGRVGRQILHANGALWIGAEEAGLWRVPLDGGTPSYLGPEAGVPFPLVDGILALDASRLLLTGEGKTAELPLSAFARTRPLPDEDLLNGYLACDKTGYIWANMDGKLRRWDGETWRDFDPPTPLQRLHIIDFDTEGRLWLVTHSDSDPVLVFNPANETWSSFSTLRAALFAQRQAHPTLEAGTDEGDDFRAVFSDDGRIAVRRNGLEYYDGTLWREFEYRYQPEDGPANFAAIAFRKSDGLLEVTDDAPYQETTYSVWALHPEGWRLVRRGPEEQYSEPSPEKRFVQRQSADSYALDSEGVLWYTKSGRLHKYLGGISASAFPEDVSTPFLSGKKVVSVLVDRKGNRFINIGTAQFGGEYVCVRAGANPPDTRVTLERVEESDAWLAIAATPPVDAWYQWRMDEGPWSAPMTDGSVQLSGLQPGQHRFEAKAIGPDFLSDPTPAVALIEVTFNPEELVAAWLSKLSNDDFEVRKEAVRQFARYPEISRRILLEAQVSASEDARWWIDAALAELDRAETQTSAPEE